MDQIIASGDRSSPGGGSGSDSSQSLKQLLVTTCVGSKTDLEEMVREATRIFEKVWMGVTSKTDGVNKISAGKKIISIIRHATYRSS